MSKSALASSTAAAAYTPEPVRRRPVIRLSLHARQMEVFKSKARFRVIVAGRRWGKTQLCKIAIITEARKRKRLIWYVAPTYQMARQIMWNDLVESIPRAWIKKQNETLMTIVLVNGTIIQLKGADKPDTLRGVGLHFVVLDEFQDMREETWTKVIRPTLSSTKGKAIIIGTPKSFNHLYDLYMLGQKAEYVKLRFWQSWQFPTITSPFIPPEEIEAAMNDMDEKSFRQEYEASFETMSGRVYHAFDRRVNVKRCPFNPRLPIWVGQDFNNDPMSGVIIQPQPNGELWIVDEIVMFSSSTEEVTEEIDRRYFKYQKRVTIYPDPAGRHKQHARGESDLDIFRQAGYRRLKYRRKHPAIIDRVNAVNRMLRAADGTVRLYVDDKNKHTIQSFEQTIYKPGTREIDKKMGVEHLTDAAGYPIELEFPVRGKFVPTGVSI